MTARAHIAAIAPTLDQARLLARRLDIPVRNAISERSVDSARGRSFAGYILAPGHNPSPAFWETFTPALLAVPTYTADELRAMLTEAERHEADHDRRDAELALALR